MSITTIAGMLAIVVVHWAEPISAATLDMAAITCKDFLAAKDPGGANLMWMSGYFAAKAGETILDTDRHVKVAGQLGFYCRNNPTATMMEAYRRALVANPVNH